MTDININPEDRNSPIQFFPSRGYAEQAVCDHESILTGRPMWRKVRLWTVWYVRVNGQGYLRENGSVY